MSSGVDTGTRRAQQVTAAKKKASDSLGKTDPQLNQFRAARTPSTADSHSATLSTASSAGLAAAANSSTADADADADDDAKRPATLPRRIPRKADAASPDVFDTAPDAQSDAIEDAPPLPPPPRHARGASRHRRQQSSMSWPPPTGPNATRPSVMGFFDVPALEHHDEPSSSSGSAKPCDSESSDRLPREIVTTPATPPAECSALADDDDEDGENRSVVKARLDSFSFGSKASKPNPLLPSLPLRRRSPEPSFSMGGGGGGRPHSHHSALDALGPGSDHPPNAGGEERSPRQRRRHSHNRSASISLPNLKLGGRSASLGFPSPGLPPSSPSTTYDATSRSSHSTPKSGGRLRFEPSDKEKEESRRRALDKLTGGGEKREEPASKSIVLPSFDDEDDDFSITSSRPPSDALNSTASSSRPSSFSFPSATSSFNGSGSGCGASPLPWASGFDDTDRWNLNQRFDHAREEPVGFGFDLTSGAKTSSVLLNSNLGVLAEEDETESEALEQVEDVASPSSAPGDTTPYVSSTPSAPTPSRLRELHLVSSVSTAGSSRRSSNPEALQAFSRAAAAEPSPTKGYSATGRGRPRPLTLESRTSSGSGSTRPLSMNSAVGRRPTNARSSISYKKDDSGSASSRGAMSPPAETSELITSPESTTSPPLGDWASRNSRQCPRPRSAILGGLSNRVLGEVDEGDENDSEAAFRSFELRDDTTMSEASRDSFDGMQWGRRRDSRERIDAEMERDALREDVDLWRKRCRGLEDRLEAERRETGVLRDRVRKLGDRLLTVSSATDSSSPTEEHEAAQSRLIAEMRDQLFALTSALDRERKEKLDAQARAAELQSALDEGLTPHVTPLALPTTPKVRNNFPSLTSVMATPPEAKYADADLFADAGVDDEVPPPNANDPNWNRMRGWGFPQGPVNTETDRANKRESFFGLSRPRAVRAAPSESQSGLGIDWLKSPLEPGFDLPPFEVNDANRTLVREAPRVDSSPATRRPRPSARDFTPERQVSAPTTYAATSSSPLSFLAGYLPLPRTTPPNSNPNATVPRVMITPSSVSPKKPLKHLAHHGSFVVPGCEVDFRDSCSGCSGPVIDL